MNPERTERMTEWDARPFDGGYDGLRSLVDRSFSGAVTNGIAWAVLVNGRIVGVYDGALSAFEGADGTAYEAPEPAVALLFAMQESAGEPRAQYYTEETPISTVDETLSEGKFTGYVELSENVLSGDYYVVYSAGKSTGVAFVGNSDTLHTGEEAFERAADEVGIYEVYDADLDIVELPEPADQSAGVERSADVEQPTGAEHSGDSAGADVAGSDEGNRPAASDATGETESSETDATEAEADGSASSEPDARDPEPSEPEAAESASSEPRVEEPSSETDEVVTEADPAAGSAGQDSNAEADSSPSPGSKRRDHRGSERADPADGTGSSGREGGSDTDGTDPENVFSEEAAWRQAQTIPALDPDETERRPDRRSPRGTDPGDRARRSATQRRPRDADGTRSSGESGRDRRPGGSDGSAGSTGQSAESTGDRGAAPDASSEVPDGRIDELNDRIEELEAALAEERDRKEALEERREELVDERDQYEMRASRLESRVAELESEIERLRDRLSEAGDAASGAERTMQPEVAIAGTNLFVRYDSKGSPTLEAVHSGEATREELSSNLQLEHHTSFEDEGAVVDGRPFREFLHGTVEYRFTRWVVEELPFEIRETGNVNRLRDLYDAIPDVDRVELDGTIAVSSTSAEGERENESFTFDVVFRDRMGDPLFVANLNDSRDPTTESMVETLVSNAGTVAEKYDDFAAALSVTASFFDPGALDATADATGGGLLSRSKRASFVKLSRKRGFHLCLIETREGGFHLNVPEL
ncbi:MAG: hypothetical protein V5A46_03185 [Haloferacaceae archaeon]